jgi:hypothetical protein
VVTVDSTAGNRITTGTVVRSDPSHALLEVTNNYHFWVAVDLVSENGAVLRPAALTEDLGGLFAGGGLIDPSGTAAWDGVFDSSTGGLATIRVHYDVTSAGGAVALAGNILTIIADSLGASIAASSANNLVKSFTLVMDLPSFADLGQEIQKQDAWGLARSIEILLGSSSGRATIKEALAGAGVLASDSQLLKVASVVGIIDWARTLFDLMRASIGGTTDGTVTFSVAGSAATSRPTPTPLAAITPAPTPTRTAAPTPTRTAAPTPTHGPTPVAPPSSNYIANVRVVAAGQNAYTVSFDWGYSGDHGTDQDGKIAIYPEISECTPSANWGTGYVPLSGTDAWVGTGHSSFNLVLYQLDVAVLTCSSISFWFLLPRGADPPINFWPNRGLNWSFATSWVGPK